MSPFASARANSASKRPTQSFPLSWRGDVRRGDRSTGWAPCHRTHPRVMHEAENVSGGIVWRDRFQGRDSGIAWGRFGQQGQARCRAGSERRGDPNGVGRSDRAFRLRHGGGTPRLDVSDHDPHEQRQNSDPKSLFRHVLLIPVLPRILVHVLLPRPGSSAMQGANSPIAAAHGKCPPSSEINVRR